MILILVFDVSLDAEKQKTTSRILCTAHKMAQGIVFEKSQRFSAFGNAESYTEFLFPQLQNPLVLCNSHPSISFPIVKLCSAQNFGASAPNLSNPASSTPSDTKISHPPRTYIKFPCLQDIEKGHRNFTFRGRTICEVQYLELRSPRFQETFGEPASDEVLGRSSGNVPWARKGGVFLGRQGCFGLVGGGFMVHPELFF